MTFESAFLPSCLKRGRSLQFATNWLSFEILRPVNPFKLEVHSETTWPTPKCRHLAQCASFLLLGFWLSMATEKASRLMLVEQRPMMLLGASCFHCNDCDEPVSQVPCLLCLTQMDGTTMELIFCKTMLFAA